MNFIDKTDTGDKVIQKFLAEGITMYPFFIRLISTSLMMSLALSCAKKTPNEEARRYKELSDDVLREIPENKKKDLYEFVAKKQEAFDAVLKNNFSIEIDDIEQMKFIFLIEDRDVKIYREYVVRKPNRAFLDYGFALRAVFYDDRERDWKLAIKPGMHISWVVFLKTKNEFFSISKLQDRSDKTSTDFKNIGTFMSGRIPNENFDIVAKIIFDSMGYPYTKQIDEHGDFIRY